MRVAAAAGELLAVDRAQVEQRVRRDVRRDAAGVVAGREALARMCDSPLAAHHVLDDALDVPFTQDRPLYAIGERVDRALQLLDGLSFGPGARHLHSPCSTCPAVWR